MTLDEIQENRGQFVKEVAKIANESITLVKNTV